MSYPAPAPAPATPVLTPLIPTPVEQALIRSNYEHLLRYLSI